MSTPGLYPFSTQGGDAIPMEIIKPVSMIASSFTANLARALTLPWLGLVPVMIYSTTDCIIKVGAPPLPDAIVSGTTYDRTMFIPGTVPMTVLLQAGGAYILGFASGSIYITILEQWAAIKQDQQTRIA